MAVMGTSCGQQDFECMQRTHVVVVNGEKADELVSDMESLTGLSLKR